jgi:hypothetical protein
MAGQQGTQQSNTAGTGSGFSSSSVHVSGSGGSGSSRLAGGGLGSSFGGSSSLGSSSVSAADRELRFVDSDQPLSSVPVNDDQAKRLVVDGTCHFPTVPSWVSGATPGHPMAVIVRWDNTALPLPWISVLKAGSDGRGSWHRFSNGAPSLTTTHWAPWDDSWVENDSPPSDRDLILDSPSGANEQGFSAHASSIGTGFGAALHGAAASSSSVGSSTSSTAHTSSAAPLRTSTAAAPARSPSPTRRFVGGRFRTSKSWIPRYPKPPRPLLRSSADSFDRQLAEREHQRRVDQRKKDYDQALGQPRDAHLLWLLRKYPPSCASAEVLLRMSPFATALLGHDFERITFVGNGQPPLAAALAAEVQQNLGDRPMGSQLSHAAAPAAADQKRPAHPSVDFDPLQHPLVQRLRRLHTADMPSFVLAADPGWAFHNTLCLDEGYLFKIASFREASGGKCSTVSYRTLPGRNLLDHCDRTVGTDKREDIVKLCELNDRLSGPQIVAPLPQLSPLSEDSVIAQIRTQQPLSENYCKPAYDRVSATSTRHGWQQVIFDLEQAATALTRYAALIDDPDAPADPEAACMPPLALANDILRSSPTDVGVYVSRA